MKTCGTVCCVSQTSICLQSWADGDVKSVNTHHTLQCEHSSENDWLPFCPLRLSAVMTFNRPAEWACVWVSRCRCVRSINLWIKWQYFQIFITCKSILTSGTYCILSGSWPFRPVEMKLAAYSCAFFIVWGKLYLSPFIVTWHLAVSLSRGRVIRGLTVHCECLSRWKDFSSPSLSCSIQLGWLVEGSFPEMNLEMFDFIIWQKPLECMISFGLWG